MAKKQYDPLWEIVDEKVALQGGEPDIDAVCPWCHVIVHLGKESAAGRTYECGLCGGLSEVVEEAGSPGLKRVD